jgi:hypothetical protein
MGDRRCRLTSRTPIAAKLRSDAWVGNSMGNQGAQPGRHAAVRRGALLR